MNTNKTPQTLLDQLNSKKWIIWGIIILSLVFRLWFSFFTDFSRDEIKIYEKGFSFYKTGHLPITGAEIAYSSTELPGSLQALLTGVPLFLSKGEPWGASLFVAFLNFFAVFLIFAIYIMLFPKINQTMLCLFIFWSPWSYLFTSIWNPSFLPFFSALFFWGMIMCFKNNKHFLGSTLIGFSIMIIVQLHLSFVLLVSILSSMLILKTIRMPNIAGIILGGLIGGLTLIPYFYHYFSATTTETASNASAFLFKNMMFNSDALFYFPKIFFRFLSFPTGETSRFIGRDSGIQATLIYIYDNPALWLPWLIGQIVTLYWIALGTKFYLQKSMEVIFKILRIKKEQKHPSDSIIHEKYSTLTFIVPFITYILFFFSIKEPSAHTYWILLPLAFFPVLENLTQDKRNDHFIPLLPSRLQILGLMVVTLCFLSYSLPGHLKEKNLKIYKVNTSTLSN